MIQRILPGIRLTRNEALQVNGRPAWLLEVTDPMSQTTTVSHIYFKNGKGYSLSCTSSAANLAGNRALFSAMGQSFRID